MFEEGWSPLALFGLATCLKVLLIPSYLSTDFEVHRNWLAVTYSKPLKEWYFEDTSEWTLDYPPFFAYFEWALAQVAVHLDPGMVKISATPYLTPVVVGFQRGSVIVSDVLLFFGVLANIRAWHPNVSRTKASAVAALVLLNAGLLMVDHMHFQYNGMMMGLLLLSIAEIRQHRELVGSVLFACLLMFKHLFLSLAPAYFVYLLRHYCFSSRSTPPRGSSEQPSLGSFRLLAFLSLGLSVLAVFAAGLGPFLLHDPLAQGQQMLRRLFPFGRGLVHAYWAPNAYAVYCLADTALAFVLRRAGKLPASTGAPTWTSGLVQEIEPEVLFRVTPAMTAGLTLLSMLPALASLWRHRDGVSLVYGLFQSSLCAYMFGWHVHEKALIVSLVLLALVAVEHQRYARLYLWLSVVGHASLFPLFPPLSPETPTKLALALLGAASTYTALHATTGLTLGPLEWAYALGLAAVIAFTEVVHPVWVVGRLPFLARLASSSYCVLGVGICFLQSYRLLGPQAKLKGE